MKKSIDEIISDCYSEKLSLSNNLLFNEIMQSLCDDYVKRFKVRFDGYLNYYKTVQLAEAIRDASFGLYVLNGKQKET